jgi:predicted metal-dependent HD superfamily phosphohydrolase
MILSSIIYIPKMFEYGFDIDLNCADFSSINLYNSILNKYTQQHRVYHTLTHIENMGKWYFEWCGTTHQLPTREMCLAILYHDIIYNIGSIYNEVESASFFLNHAGLMGGVEDHMVDVVNDLIVSTEIGFPIQTRLADLDLVILGTCNKTYMEYAKGIKMEYRAIPDATFCENRIKFLTLMLAKQQIFADETLRSLYEDRARRNISKEIDILSTFGTTLLDDWF